MAKTLQSELSPAERLDVFKQTLIRPVVLRGENAVSAAASLVNGHPGEFVATGHSGFTVTHPTENRPLDRGERFTCDAAHFPRIVKALALGRVIPAAVYDQAQEYEAKRFLWESELQPSGAEYANSLKAVDQAEALLVAARAALKAAEERLTLSKDAAHMAETRLIEVLDESGL